MRKLLLAAAVVFVSTSAVADDTKPPQISDVKATVSKGKVNVEARITDETGVLSAVIHHRTSGGTVQDAPMVKNDFDDIFKASFPGGGDTEYWIESSDLLGNGPSTYGSASKPMAAGGKPGKGAGGAAVATREKPPKEEPAPREEPREQEHPKKQTHVARKSSEPPTIEHRKPSTQPPEGRDFAVRMKIKSESPVAVAILQVRQQGSTTASNMALTHTEGDSYEAVIPAAQAKGTLEYWIAAKNAAGQMARQGDGDVKTPYTITFKPSQAVASGGAAGPYQFSHFPLYRVTPGRPVTVRTQVVPTSDSGELPDRVVILWRGQDAQDQLTDMDSDPTGGYGGYKALLPPQEEGAIYYQIVACDAGGKACGDDTGSKRRWHSAMVSAQPGSAQPMPIDAVSSKAPPSLPE